ncbi:6790_t:CDS:2 [Acaulospora morrowiae]|uniref:6790_t:CDS:1 n=1 Tax=Acaulospora morrowiae TaxID=94023 RepID=A0A9N8YQH2_9GLOM|nr:6790_t:CDS:2 [Acaulospora morrowiae]
MGDIDHNRFSKSREQTQRFNNNPESSSTVPKIKVLFRSEEFLVVDKPYDVRIDGDVSKGSTVLSILCDQEPDIPKPLRNVHQLDHSTSGCYCLALTKEAAGLASVAFAQRRVEKNYLAIVRGWMEEDAYTVEQPIAEVPNNRYRMCIGSEDNPGKAAKTEIRVIRRGYFYPMPLQLSSSNSPINVTLINLRPITGRRHQLRLHCQYLGHPIVGDWHYEKQSMDYTDTFLVTNNSEDEAIRILQVESNDPFSELVLENLINN